MNLTDTCTYIDSLAQGETDVLVALAELRTIAAAATKAATEIDEAAINAANLYPEKTFTKHGFVFTKSDGRKNYKYDHIQSWKATKAELKAIEDQAKKAADIQNDPKFQGIVTQDGELAEAAHITYTKASIAITVPK